MSILLKCFLFAILTRFAECGSCLNPELYHPCKCQNLISSPVLIHCLGGPTIEDAAKIFRALNGKVNDPVTFIITDTKSERIEEKIFGDVPVEIAILNLPELKYLSNSSFIGQEDIMVELEFKSSNLEQIPYQGQLKKLTHFRFYDNQAITIIRKSWFSGIQNGNVLEMLFIYNTTIQSIEKYAFSELVALRYLDLSENRISALDSNIISTNLPLKNVLLNLNRLTKLPVDFIKLLPNEVEIYISVNNITDISAETLELITEKELKIEIYENPLKCDCEWLSFINGSLTKEWKTLISGECQGPDSTEMDNIYDLNPKDFRSCK